MERIYQSFGFLFSKAVEQLQAALEPFLKAHQLVPKQLGMLLIISSQPGITQKEAGARQQTDRTTVTQIADTFEKRGLVERRPVPTDRRANGLFLTASGEALARECFEELERVQRNYFAVLTDEQVEQLHRMMMTIIGGSFDET